jgi:hypothetical protein
LIIGWQIARMVAWLKRICAAIESIAGSLQELVAIERERTPARRGIRRAEISVSSVKEWNKQWEQEHPVAEES